MTQQQPFLETFNFFVFRIDRACILWYDKENIYDHRGD